jgi:serine/threonine protein kinase
MSGPSLSDTFFLPPEAARRIDRVCDDFESAWQAGQRPRLEQYLRQANAAELPPLLWHLLFLELTYRRQGGETCTLQEYQDRFPDSAELVAAVFRKITEEPANPPTPPVARQDGETVSAAPQPPSAGAEATTPPGQVRPEPVADLPSIAGYELHGPLGRPSGMGVVYKARQVSLNRIVALKMIRTGDQAGPQELARFRIEAEAVARLQHPNIVQIYDFGEHDRRPFFAMEFVSGGDLAARLAGKPLPAPEAARLMEILARAMDYVHRNNIVHRDLKPANVLLAADGTPKIADFGLAKRLNAAGVPGITWQGSASGVILGTASYMAPEQAGGKVHEIGPAADVYALGAILYEMLTGRPPFVGDTWNLTVLQVLSEEPALPSHLQPDVPEDLQSICLKCLAKEAAARYASCQALADDLRRFLAGEPLSIATINEWDWRERWARSVGYEIQDVMTCGVWDVVYKARELSLLERTVALKVLTVNARAEADARDRFRSEAQTVSRLKHPNIVSVYGFDEKNGHAYLAMEYVEGGSLVEKFTDTPVPPAQAADLVAQLAQAIGHAHQRGIIHAALKPSNVLLTPDGIPKITNFGLAVLLEREREQSVQSTALRRLPVYTAPELVDGRLDEVGPATDVYALGAILYQLLTGEPPFLRDTVQETLAHFRTEQPVPPSALQPAIPRGLEAVCLKCLHKDPACRPPTAEALADALREFLKTKETDTDDFELVPGYDVFEELGRGGLGVVYRAQHVGLNRLMALKIFNRLEPDWLGRVQAATRAVGQLQHPNIVRVFDCGVRDGRLYVAEEFVDGVPLDERLAVRSYPPEDAAHLLDTLARAVHHAHEHGIVHRNLKPRVVLIARDGLPKITSFELARVPGQATEVQDTRGGFVGTPRYMAPEQLTGDPAAIGPPTDVYALGAILYQMLTGRYLYRGDTLQEIVEQVLHKQPEPPRSVNPQVPPGLDAICLKCLHKEPRHRPAGAAALADELRRLLRGSAWERAVRWIYRRWRSAT